MKQLLIALGMVFLTACAATEQSLSPIKDTEVFGAPFEKVWMATLASIAEMGIGIDTIEKNNGLITTKDYHIKPEGLSRPMPTVLGEYAQKPISAVDVWNDAWYRIFIIITTEGERMAKVKIIALFNGIDASNTKRLLPSRGKIEAELFSAIRDKL